MWEQRRRIEDLLELNGYGYAQIVRPDAMNDFAPLKPTPGPGWRARIAFLWRRTALAGFLADCWDAVRTNFDRTSGP